MPEMHLMHFSSYRSFTKNKERIRKFKETED